MLTGDKELVRLARLPSWEYDGHSANAALLFHGDDLAAFKALQKSDPKLAKLQRHVGKITSHGAQRGMRGARQSDNILKELGIYVSPEKCDSNLSIYHRRYPAIQASYFRDIRRQVMRDRLLVNSWGRVWDLKWDRIDDELYRAAYSFLPQSEVADLLNQWGLVPTYYYLKSLTGRPPNIQVHDSMLTSVAPQDAYDVAVFIAKSLERPRLYAGNQLVIPVEFKLGLNWGADEKAGEGFEFKRLPSRAEFEEKAMWLDGRRVSG